MPVPVDQLFHSHFEVGTHRWNVDVFRRAYLYPGSPFERVIRRIQDGFSVLVYIPGNCMRAAAEVLRAQMNALPWKEYGLAEANAKTIADVWRAYTGLFDFVRRWIPGEDAARPYAIFHNLDMLSDSRGGLDMSNEARTALFYLTECSRSGVVLGLSDVSAGPLPEAIRRPFGEEVWLDEIPMAHFPYLMPSALGENLAKDDALPEGTAHLLASRLRWTDPIRAVRIMDSICTAKTIEDALARIAVHTKSVEFTDPASLDAKLKYSKDELPPGYDKATVCALKRNVIHPFQRWATYVGDHPAEQLRRLPSGIILHGPPGTGKSLLAQWLASGIGIPFRQVSAADLKRSAYGLTEQMVRDLFRSARRASPCMIVLDDADDLLPDRERATGGTASAERGVVNAFLQEMEGFGPRLEGVLVVLTTNRFHHLDKAARSRLTLKFRIPYPLDTDQIKNLVLQIGSHYGIDRGAWNSDILKRLVNFFFKPLRPVQERVEDRSVRERMDDHLFSPREISAAMRMLVTKGGLPEPEDLDRMEAYYDNLAKEPEEASRMSE